MQHLVSPMFETHAADLAGCCKMCGEYRNKTMPEHDAPKRVRIATSLLMLGGVLLATILMPLLFKDKKFPYEGVWKYEGIRRDGTRLMTVVSFKNGGCGVEIRSHQGSRRSVSCSYTMLRGAAVVQYKIDNIYFINRPVRSSNSTAKLSDRVTPQRHGAELLLEPLKGTYTEQDTNNRKRTWTQVYKGQGILMKRVHQSS